jgi:hypothetical protein
MQPAGCGIPLEDGGVHGLGGKGLNHSGYIPSLPRDLKIARLHAPTPTDAGFRLLNAFVPELQQLRVASSHVRKTQVAAETVIASGSMLEIAATFGAVYYHTSTLGQLLT